ncbi:MAG TPA: DegT/DnrJ/EryC1/StrS family aminotransferase [Anaerolineae bacterium]|nr:DegT/DnrJ/EryC1/StrS family aminotransferase [Anaerolineae bacterium]HNT06482.1 DegT/DnrJ/EryC1/StrS family aminotransferase [Anaerolineae bacterium]
MISISAPMLGQEEKQAILQVIDSGQLAQGKRVKAFEEAFAAVCGVKHAVATSSGTTALHAAVLAHGIGPGDEVITTPFTFIASANAAVFTGARPVFVDIDERSYNIDPCRIEAAITPRTKAILPVHLFGNPCDMDAIMAIAKKHGLIVIEDACQAHGATVQGRKVGSFGTGCFSFYPTKNITTAEGGIVTTNDDVIADRLRLIRSHGQRERYYHESIGYNFRMTEIQAAIGLAQLEKLASFTRARQEHARYLSERLQGVVTPTFAPGLEHVFHQYTIRVPDAERDALAEHLHEKGIGTMIYYPVPVHRQKVYLDMGYNDHLPVAEQASREVLSLPVHPALTIADLDRIIQGVNSR